MVVGTNKFNLYVPLAVLFDRNIRALADLYKDKFKELMATNPLAYVSRVGPLSDIADWINDEEVARYIAETPNLIERSPRNSLISFIPIQILGMGEDIDNLKITLYLDTAGFTLSKEDEDGLKITLAIELGPLIEVKLINYGEINISIADYYTNYQALYFVDPSAWLARHMDELSLMTIPTTNVIFKPLRYSTTEKWRKEKMAELMADPAIPLELKENIVNKDWAEIQEEFLGKGHCNFSTLPHPVLTGIIPETRPIITEFLKLTLPSPAYPQ